MLCPVYCVFSLVPFPVSSPASPYEAYVNKSIWEGAYRGTRLWGCIWEGLQDWLCSRSVCTSQATVLVWHTSLSLPSRLLQLAGYHNAEQPLSVCTNMFTQYNYNDVDSWFFSVNVSAKRVGGAYGAKITRGHQIAAACGLGAYITKRYTSVPRFNL